MDIPIRDAIFKSLKDFKRRRDALLFEDVRQLEYHLKRFIEFCERDALVQQMLTPLPNVDSAAWWEKLSNQHYRRNSEPLEFPDDSDEELSIRFAVMKDVVSGKASLQDFGTFIRIMRVPDLQQSFLSLIVRPFCEELSDRLNEIANIPGDEFRALQAVPPHLIPGPKETRIFLSHKTVDKPFVQRYERVLRELGYNPWLDTSNLRVGASLDRGIVQGLKESCAIVFFITQNFTDDRFIADEIDYAKSEKRNKGERFSIITLRFAKSADIPALLQPYVYKDIEHELDGLYEIIRALPIELKPERWKEHVVHSD